MKWFLLFCLIVLVLAGFRLLTAEGPVSGWWRAAPVLAVMAAVVGGMVYALRAGLARRKEMAAHAVRLGWRFEKQKMDLCERGIGVLKQFYQCRPVAEKSFLQRVSRLSFQNVISGDLAGGEVYVFDCYSIVGRQGPNFRGTYACYHRPGARLPDLLVEPSRWHLPQWAKDLMGVKPLRREVREAPAGGLAGSYRVETSGEAGLQAVPDRFWKHFSQSGNAGWRFEASGEWAAATRLAPAKNLRRPANPMDAAAQADPDVETYMPGRVTSRDLPEFLRQAEALFQSLAGR